MKAGKRSYFNVIGHLGDEEVGQLDYSKTAHYNNEVNQRHNKIFEIIGDGKCFGAFLVDKAHPNGNEIHLIFDNGIILILNERTNKIITEFIARPAQIYRYWNSLNERFPMKYRYVIDKAKEHEEKGYNYW